MATEAEFWGRPLEPGPVKMDPNAMAARALSVRQALLHLATDPKCCEELPVADRELAWRMARASDETLNRLARLLK